MKNKVIIIPGLGDRVKMTQWATRNWSKYGLEPIVFSANWYSDEILSEKLKRLLDQIDLYNGDKVSLIGCSAGASLALNAFIERKDSLNKVVSVCGRLKTGSQKGFRSLETRARKSKSFFDSVKLFEAKEHLLSPIDRSKIMTVRPMFGDELVPASTSTIEEAKNITVFTPEHTLSIYATLSLFSKSIIGFLKTNKIYEVFVLSELLSQKIQASLPLIAEILHKSKFKYVGRSLLAFIPKSGFLMSSLIASCHDNNPYSASILFRSLIEHNFRHLYIYVRALNDDSDSVGEEYYHSLKGNEDLESVEKILNYKKIVYPEETQWNTKGDHNNAIREVAKQFRIEKIFHYLINNNNSGNNKEIVKKYKKEYLLERLIQYTNMSSSVHGGPFGELALYELQKDKSKRDKTMEKFISDSFNLHKSIVESTYLFASLVDIGAQKHYEDIANMNKA